MLQVFPADDWRAAMAKVHARFRGRKGTFAHFGDSITETMAFWTPLPHARKNAPPEMERAFRRVKDYLRPEGWREGKGPEYGNKGGQTVRWALENVDGWLKRLDPEVALILFGSNDLHSVEAGEYRRDLEALVRRCLDNGTVVLLSTIPPRHGFEAKAAAFADAARAVARDLSVPLTDYHAEILRRRPDDWNGALEKFRAYDGYDVPTLIARDGVHPSHPKRFQDDYSEEALRSNGYSLRNYLVLLKYAEVIDALSAPPPANPEREKYTMTSISPPSQPWFPRAKPLPPPKGEVIRAGTVPELFAAAERVRPGGTILVADGHYPMTRRLELKTDRVTLRGASGRRERVLLDGGGIGELVALTACSDVTIADLTVQNVKWNGIKINSETGVHRAVIYNCILHNIWERAVKGVKVPEKDREKIRPRECRVEFCLFYNDRAKQYSDDANDNPNTFGGNYIGGIDTMFAKGWVIRDNVFVGIQGRTRGARGAIFIWHESEDCVVERNIIIDCDSGICLGNSHKPDDVRLHCRRFIVRNNFVTRAPENGILADYTEGCKIVNNTVHHPDNRLGRLLRLVHDNDGLLAANNLLSGPPIRNESQSRMTFRNNVEKDMTGALADPAQGNLRLTEKAVEAIDRGMSLPEVRDDIDGRRRGRTPDIGAHEWTAGREA